MAEAAGELLVIVGSIPITFVSGVVELGDSVMIGDKHELVSVYWKLFQAMKTESLYCAATADSEYFGVEYSLRGRRC